MRRMVSAAQTQHWHVQQALQMNVSEQEAFLQACLQQLLCGVPARMDTVTS